MNMLANITRPEGDPKIIASGPSGVPAADRLARALGWFSIGLGAVQLAAPHLLTRALGMRGSEGLMRLFGAREVASGMLTLSTERPTGIASRIAGDVLDIAVLASALGADNRKRGNVGLALALVAGVTLLDLAAKKALADTHGRRGPPRSYADRSGFPKRRAGARLESQSDTAGPAASGAGGADRSPTPTADRPGVQARVEAGGDSAVSQPPAAAAAAKPGSEVRPGSQAGHAPGGKPDVGHGPGGKPDVGHAPGDKRETGHPPGERRGPASDPAGPAAGGT